MIEVHNSQRDIARLKIFGGKKYKDLLLKRFGERERIYGKWRGVFRLFFSFLP